MWLQKVKPRRLTTMKLKMCSRPQSGSAGLAVSLLAPLLLLQVILLGGSLALRGQPNRQSGAAEALLGLGATVFAALVAGRNSGEDYSASLQPETACRSNEHRDLSTK
jgi:hypothetical protein